MVSTASITRYWAATVIIICIVYWSFRVATTSTQPLTNKLTSLSMGSEASRPRPDMSDDIQDHVVEAAQASFMSDKSYPPHFPRIVWQTASEHGKEKYAEKADTWKAVKGFEYKFLTGQFSGRVHTLAIANGNKIMTPMHSCTTVSLPVLRSSTSGTNLPSPF
jgi:hypothetical protein